MGKDCNHKWSVVKIDTCKMGKMTIGVPVYKCKKCGAEK